MKTLLNLKKSIAILAMSLSVVGLFGQNPTGMTQQHQSSGAESIDSVTVGSVMRYFAMPDLNINQDGDGAYDYTTNRDALISTFTWSSDGGETATEIEENYAEFTWSTSNVTRTITVTETASGCAGTPVTFDVQVIDAPEVGFTAAGGSESFCETDADGSLSVSPAAIATTINSDVNNNKDVVISYTITCTNTAFNGGAALSGTASVADGATDFSISESLTHYGVYTITLDNVTDRISRKPDADIAGTLLANTTFTVNVSRTPSTGGIFRLPNN